MGTNLDRGLFDLARHGGSLGKFGVFAPFDAQQLFTHSDLLSTCKVNPLWTLFIDGASCGCNRIAFQHTCPTLDTAMNHVRWSGRCTHNIHAETSSIECSAVVAPKTVVTHCVGDVCCSAKRKPCVVRHSSSPLHDEEREQFVP